MTDDVTRHDDEPQEPLEDATQPAEPDVANQDDDSDDPYVQALRDIPRMSTLNDSPRKASINAGPPPPFVARVGGFVQGCGGLLLALLSIPMVLVALWFGFYVWGPALFFGGGALLFAATFGVWAARRTPIILSTIVIVFLAILAYFWATFLPAAAALSPIPQLSAVYAPIMVMLALVLLVALGINIMLLFQWSRHKLSTRNGLLIWGVAAPLVVTLAVALHVSQQSQRESWLEDQLDKWQAEAASDTLMLGGNANVTLGYSFLAAELDGDTAYDIRAAELDALLETGIQFLRLSASGDAYLERQEARMYSDEESEDSDEDEMPPAEKAAARLDRQAEQEADYMALVQAADIDLFLSDSQYSPYFLLWANDEEELSWDTFVELHTARVERFATELHPAYYELITEPENYYQFSAVNDEGDEDDRIDLWIAHLEDLIAVVDEASPDTKVGVTIALQSDFDLDFYERALEIEDLDFVSFRAYQPGVFDMLEDVFEERGHPVDAGKELWMVETWYGYCLAPQRSEELDSMWLETALAFAAKERMAGVLVSDYGCFLNDGGTLFMDVEDLNRRTDTWLTWESLVREWQSE